MAGHATQDKEIGQDIDDVDRFELAVDADPKALVGKLVDDIEHAVFAAIMGAILDKVIGPRPGAFDGDLELTALLRPARGAFHSSRNFIERRFAPARPRRGASA
jgi:hypothetical protein